MHGILRRSSSITRFRSRCTSFGHPPTWCSRWWADMLASSPSPSAALRPGSSSSPSAHSLARSNTHSHPHPPVLSSTSSQPATSPSLQAPPAYRYPSSAVAHDCHYEPARTATIPTTSGSSSSNNNSHFSPRSSRVAIEELRSALNRHTVESSPQGPSGDLPRGRMSAGLNSLGGRIPSHWIPLRACFSQ